MSAPIDVLMERATALVEKYDETQDPEFAHAANEALSDLYRRDGRHTDPDVALMLAKLRAICAKPGDDPTTLDEALDIVGLAILADRNNFDARIARAAILAAQAHCGDESALDESIREARKALVECPTRHWVSCAEALCDSLELRHTLFNDDSVLDEIHDLLSKVCRRKAGRSHPEFVVFVAKRAVISRDIAILRQNRPWAAQAVRDARFLVRHAPHEPDAWWILHSALQTIGEISPRPHYLFKARDVLARGLNAVARSDSGRLHELLSRNLQLEYDLRGKMDVLTQAERHAALAVRLQGGVKNCPADALINLAVCLDRRSHVRPNNRDQKRATRYARIATKAEDGQADPMCREHAGLILLSAFERLGDQSLVDEAIGNLNVATSLNPKNDIVWLNLAEALLTRFNTVSTPDQADLDAATDALNIAENLLGQDSPQRSIILSHRSYIQRGRFTISTDLGDLTSACALAV